jgi:hypothetical protein
MSQDLHYLPLHGVTPYQQVGSLLAWQNAIQCVASLLCSHGPTELEEEDTTFVLLPHREFLERKRRSDFHKMFSKERPAKGNLSEAKTAPGLTDKEMISEAGSASVEKPLSGVKRKSAGEKWEPLAFSSTFPCQFCGDKFGQDYNLKLHLHTAHPEQSDEQVQEAKV